MLFVVVKNDRKMRIEVGYGLEGALNDATCSSILRNDVAPKFRGGDFYNGIKAGLDAIIKAVKGEYKVVKKDKKENSDLIDTIFTIIMIIIFLLSFTRGSRGRGGGIFFIGSGFGTGRFSGGSSFAVSLRGGASVAEVLAVVVMVLLK